jgi:hypothetical protein
MINIEACPFCGVTALASTPTERDNEIDTMEGNCLSVEKQVSGRGNITEYIVACIGCGARGPLADTPEAARKVWALRFPKE